MFDFIFEDRFLQDYISQNVQDPWIGTPFQGYVLMSPKQKGEFGERFVSKYFEANGSEVKKAKTSTAGHDRVIDNILTEIKFSLATRDKKGGVKKDCFIINHLAKKKDWERLVFFGINSIEKDCRLIWFTKQDFVSHLNSENPVIQHQQTGGSNNDDYFCTKVDKLLECSFVKSISEW